MDDPLISSGGAIGGQSESGVVSGDGAWLGGTEDIQNMFQQYRGAIPVVQGHYPLTRAEDPDSRKPVLRNQVHARVFNLQDAEQLGEYEKVMQQCVDQEDGARVVACTIKEPCEGVPYWSAFVQWVTACILPPNQQGAEKHRLMNKRQPQGATNGQAS